MNIEVLHILIKSACSDGIISADERIFLVEQANEIGIDEKVLNFLIENELRRIKTKKTNSNTNLSGFEQQVDNTNLDNSGFIETDNISNNNSGFTSNQPIGGETLESGFSSNNSDSKHSFVTKAFTDFKDLDTQGNMSLIQKAKYYGKWIIVKRLKPEFKNNNSYIKLFYREFENSYHLDHPHIVRILGKSKDNHGIFYYMEYVDGRPLTKLIDKNGIKSGELIKKIIIETLQALEYVHKKQIYHRDLKPDNILLTYKGDNVKIIDFGLASADYFDDYMVKVGTPRYAAPEQQTKGNIVDARADIYSLALIILEMMTGQIADLELIKKRSISSYFLVKKCLDNDYTKRYSNCSQLIKEFKKIKISNLQTTKFVKPKAVIVKKTYSKEVKKKINNKLPIKTLRTFFEFTHSIWISGKLNELNNLNIDFLKLANNNSSYGLIIHFFYSIVKQIFEKYYFIKGEYFIKTDNSLFVLTNYRIFVRESENENFELIPLFKIKKERVLKLKYQINYNKYKFWKSDWEIVTKLIQAKEWEKLENNYIELISSNKENCNNILLKNKLKFNTLDYDYSNNFIPNVNIDNLIDYTEKIWHSSKHIDLYNNIFLYHSSKIEKFKPIVNQVFNNIYPLKNEYFLLDSFHIDGIITNYRLIYRDFDSKNEIIYKIIPIFDIKKYSLTQVGNFFTSYVIEIFRKKSKNIKLKSIIEDEKQAAESVEGLNRINKIIEKSKKSVNNTIEKFIVLDKIETDKLWNSNL